jgi:hypothetical protein
MNLQCQKINSSLSNQSIIGTCSATYLRTSDQNDCCPNFKLAPEHPQHLSVVEAIAGRSNRYTIRSWIGPWTLWTVCAEMVFTEASFQPSRSVALKVRRNKIALRELRDVKMLRWQASWIQIFGTFSVIKSKIYAMCVYAYRVHWGSWREYKVSKIWKTVYPTDIRLEGILYVCINPMNTNSRIFPGKFCTHDANNRFRKDVF